MSEGGGGVILVTYSDKSNIYSLWWIPLSSSYFNAIHDGRMDLPDWLRDSVMTHMDPVP